MKKEIIIPVFIGLLALLFVITNIAVQLTKGNHWLIKKKLKLGAMILSLTSFFACGSPRSTCYDTAPSKEYTDSIENLKKQDSINNALKQSVIDDSIASAIEEKRITDSIANVNKKTKEKNAVIKDKYKKIDHVRPGCYGVPANTCYTSVAPKKEPNSLKK